MYYTKKYNSGFTLIELLVVIAILGVLASAVTIVLNPAELLAQTRDAQRFSDLDTLNKTLSLYQEQVGGSMPGAANTVYVSILDTSPSCANLSLPTLPTGWSYACSSNPKMTNSTGWIPVNFVSVVGSGISALPLDPTNSVSSGLYYMYVASTTQYQLTGLVESVKFRNKLAASPVNQLYPGVLNQGSTNNISPVFNTSGFLAYWPYNEGTGSLANDVNSNVGTWHGTGIGPGGTYYGAGKIGPYAGIFDGSTDYVTVGTVSTYVIGSSNFTYSAWIYPNGWGAGTAPIIQTGATAPAVTGFNMFLSAANTVAANVSDGANEASVSTGSIPAGNWTLVTVTKSGNTVTLWVNGVSKISSSPSFSSGIGQSQILNMGLNASDHYPGLIDDVRIYNRALSQAEIMGLYNSQK